LRRVFADHAAACFTSLTSVTHVIYADVTHGSDPAAWLTAWATVAAVVVASVVFVWQFLSFKGERRDRLAVEGEATFLRKAEQARRISAHLVGGGDALIHLNAINDSGLVATRLEAVAITDGYPGPNDQWRGSFFPLITWVLVPEPATTAVVVPPAPNLAFRLEIAFDDDNGVRWHKYGPEGLREVPKDFTLLHDLQWVPPRST
jgi:hypothetical protein